MVIPFDSITYFADPYAKFGLSFNFDENDKASRLEDMEIDDKEETAPGSVAEVISIDSFRKK